MRKRTVYFLVSAVLVAASNCFAAKVTNVELTNQNGFTAARIDVEGTIRFTHQTEIAKDGKPFRVIVDVLSATHELGAKAFLSLPKCAVVHLRSSQYSVKPERIVRLVFDMAGESVYQIDSDTKSITLQFPDKSSKSFAAWSTREAVLSLAKQRKQKKVLAAASSSAASVVSSSVKSSTKTAKTAAQLNRSIETDRQASIAATPALAGVDKQVTEQPKSSKHASNLALAKNELKKKVVSPKVEKKTVARASESKNSYPPENETDRFEPWKVAQLANTSTKAKTSTKKETTVAKTIPQNEVHASHVEKPEKATTKSHTITVKSSSKVSDPRARLTLVKPEKTVVQKPKAKTKPVAESPVGPVLASKSVPAKTNQPVVKKTKSEKKAPASVKKSTKPTGNSHKAETTVRSSSTPRNEQLFAGKPLSTSPKKSHAPKESMTKHAGHEPKPNVTVKKTTEQTGNTNKAGVTARSGSTPKNEQPSAGKPSADSRKDSPAPNVTVKKPAASKPKLNVPKKNSKADKSSPVKTDKKKKKKAVYASTNKVKSASVSKPVPVKNSKAKAEKKVSKKSKKNTTIASSSKSTKAPKKQVAQKKDNSKRATSRFRRSRGQSNKIKGTMVAEFPKRLVIKYRGRARRDPFETLVNERKTNNSLLERRAPNAEGLKLVGVIEASDGDNRALFEDTDGFGYIMKSGDKVQKGYVLRVEIDRVYFQIFEYGWSRTVALNLEEY